MRVIYFDIDTLRPDHLGCYGYFRNTSPVIDAICSEGVRFDNYYCADAPCLPSRAACLTGRFGFHNGAIGHGGSCADIDKFGMNRWFTDQQLTEGLFYRFRKAGMYTASISTFAERHSSYWYNAGFNELYNVGKGGMESAEEIMPIVENWLNKHKNSDDWMLHINLWDAHTPYRVPVTEGNYFADDPIEEWYDKVLPAHLQYGGPHGARDPDMYSDNDPVKWPRLPAYIKDKTTLKQFIDGYDCGIRYIDKQIGRIVALLKEFGIYNDVSFIITSDHGENQGELGIYGEHATADFATCRIPLIVKWKGCQESKACSALHYNVDLLPTLADLFGQENEPWWDGKSFVKSLRDEKEDEGHEYLVLSQCAHVCQRAVRFGDYLYMRTYHDGMHPFPRDMLYCVKEDPHECKNIAKDKPQLVAEAKALYLDWLEKQMCKKKNHCDPLYTVLDEGGPFHVKGNEDVFIRRLLETGREDRAHELMHEYFREDQ